MRVVMTESLHFGSYGQRSARQLCACLPVLSTLRMACRVPSGIAVNAAALALLTVALASSTRARKVRHEAPC